MKVRKFKIKISRPGDSGMKGAMQDFVHTWKLAEKRRLHEDPYDLVLTFPDISGLARIFSPGRVRLIMAVRDMKPESIYQLAKLLDRAPGNVKKDVDELAELGILELKKKRTKEQGREAVQPEYNWDGFDIAV
jgi:predicted transcriptional regulator